MLRDLKSANYGEPGAIDLYLAQVAEETKQYAKAIEHYQAITEGDRGWLAKLRIGAMYGKQGRIADAQRWLAELPDRHEGAEGPGEAGARRRCCAKRATTPARTACSRRGWRTIRTRRT